MARELTRNETNVLAFIVIDPLEWWEVCTAKHPDDAEEMLAAKINRWLPQYEAAIALPDYQTRAEKEPTSQERQ